jgi:hypothetical protein
MLPVVLGSRIVRQCRRRERPGGSSVPRICGAHIASVTALVHGRDGLRPHALIGIGLRIASHVLSVGAQIPGVSMNVRAVLRDIPTVGLNFGFVAGDVALVIRTIARRGVIPAEISLVGTEVGRVLDGRRVVVSGVGILLR